MRKYELTILVKAELKGEAKEKFLEKVEKTVKAMNGKVTKTVEMGQKQLAYKINKITEAQYISFNLELMPPSVVELEKKFNIDKEIIRFLLVKIED